MPVSSVVVSTCSDITLQHRTNVMFSGLQLLVIIVGAGFLLAGGGVVLIVTGWFIMFAKNLYIILAVMFMLNKVLTMHIFVYMYIWEA